jgi:hypothetical protein
MSRKSVNLKTIVDRRVIDVMLDDINKGKKVIPVVDNYMSHPCKQLGHVVPGSAEIVGDSLTCVVEIDESHISLFTNGFEPVYIKKPIQLLALEKSDNCFV